MRPGKSRLNSATQVAFPSGKEKRRYIGKNRPKQPENAVRFFVEIVKTYRHFEKCPKFAKYFSMPICRGRRIDGHAQECRFGATSMTEFLVGSGMLLTPYENGVLRTIPSARQGSQASRLI